MTHGLDIHQVAMPTALLEQVLEHLGGKRVLDAAQIDQLVAIHRTGRNRIMADIYRGIQRSLVETWRRVSGEGTAKFDAFYAAAHHDWRSMSHAEMRFHLRIGLRFARERARKGA